MDIQYKRYTRLLLLVLLILSLFGPWVNNILIEVIFSLIGYSLGFCAIPIVGFFIIWILSIAFFKNWLVDWLFRIPLVILFISLGLAFQNVNTSGDHFRIPSLSKAWGNYLFIFCVLLAVLSEMVFFFQIELHKTDSVQNG
jgi:hypothetical protein